MVCINQSFIVLNKKLGQSLRFKKADRMEQDMATILSIMMKGIMKKTFLTD